MMKHKQYSFRHHASFISAILITIVAFLNHNGNSVLVKASFVPYNKYSYYPTTIQTRTRSAKSNLFVASTNEEQKLSVQSSSDVIITIPQHYTNPTTPIHKNPYPSSLHKIHIKSLLSKSEAKQCLHLANKHAQETLCWTSKDSDRHVSYSTADFPIEECESMESFLNGIDFYNRLWSIIGSTYDIDVEDLDFLDFFCAHYEAKDGLIGDDNDDDGDIFEDDDEEDNDFDGGSAVMDRLDPHRDGSLLSFTIVLSESESYVGGGTVFDALRDVNPNDHPEYDGVLCENGVVRVKNPGDGVLHSGRVFHGGNTVTKGERTVLVGFVEVDERCTRDGVLKEANKEWGRSDVAENHFKRQMKMTSKSTHSSGWYRKENKFLQKGQLGNFVPAFASVVKRADKEHQRQRNLKAEDILLRDILLPRDDRGTSGIPDEILAKYGGDVTIL
jgi:hypothetical protein